MDTSRIFISLVLLAALSGCTGSGQGGQSENSNVGLSSLILPEKVSVVDPQTSGGSSGKPLAAVKSLLTGITGTDLSFITPPTDYQADEVTVYVNERSLEVFNMVNDILCSVRQTRYEVMLNAGPYRAQVDKNLCSSKRDSASSGGEASTNQSSGAGMPDYEEWIVNSYRTSAQSPHVVDLWVHSKEGPNGVPQPILARVFITEGSDTAPPYGIFKINFKALDPNDLSKVVFKAFLNAEREASGKVLLKFSAEDGNSYYIERATLDKSGDNTGSGSVLTAMTFTFMPEPYIARFNIAYDRTYFRRDESAKPSICLDRTAYDLSAWKYGLYTATAPIGTRVNLNAGFTIRKGNDYGWIGYWGAWMPNGITINDGEQVMKHDYETNSDTPYTVVKAGGKLIKHTRHEITLGDIKNIPLTFWANGNAYQVVWTGPVTKMQIAAQLVSNQTWSSFNPPLPFSLNALDWSELGFWSSSLGGSVIVKFKAPADLGITSTVTGTTCGYDTSTSKYNCSGSAADDLVPVVYYSENIVYPDDTVPSPLACFNNCPEVATLPTSSNPYKPLNNYQPVAPASSSPALYSFVTGSMMLYDSGTPVTLTTRNDYFAWGFTSGPLFDPAYLSTNLLACDINNNSTCGWKSWSVLPEYYTWETGPNDWNKFTGLKDLAGIVKFDKPIKVKYVHHAPLIGATAADTKYDNVTFFLEYNGFGNLNGIPGKCVDMDTGADADCANGGNSVRWVPEFTIRDIDPSTLELTEVTEVTDGIITPRVFLVKALEKEERMRAAAPSNCTGLPTTEYQLPQMDAYKDPALGPEPVVNAAPAVIGGVVQ